MRLFLLGAALVATPAYADCSQAERDATHAFAVGAGQCVRAEAARLERSGERAEAIATAAMVACHKHLSLLRNDCDGGLFADIMDKRLREFAVSEVVKIRAKR